MRIDEQTARRKLQQIFGAHKSMMRTALMQSWLKLKLDLEDMNCGIELMKNTGEIEETEWEGDDVRYDLVKMEK